VYNPKGALKVLTNHPVLLYCATVFFPRDLRFFHTGCVVLQCRSALHSTAPQRIRCERTFRHISLLKFSALYLII